MLFTIEYNNACKQCGLSSDISQSVNPYSHGTSDILIIKDVPSYEEYANKISTSQKVNELLLSTTSEANIDLTKITVTNAIRCFLGKTEVKETHIKFCKQFMDTDIDKLKPKVIITSGMVSYFSLTNEKLTSKDINVPVFSTYYNCYIIPTHTFGKIAAFKENRDDFIKALQLANKISNGEDWQEKVNLDYKLILTQEEFDFFMTELEQQSTIAVDIETTGLDIAQEEYEESVLSLFEEPAEQESDVSRDKILGIGFSWKKQQGRYLPFLFSGTLTNTFFYDNPNNIERLKKFLTNTSTKIFHNGQFDTKFLTRDFNVVVNGYNFDTLIASFILDENVRHSLGILGEKYSDLKGWKNKFKAKAKNVGYGGTDLEELGLYCCTDCDVTLRLFQEYLPLIDKDFKQLYYGLLMPMTKLMSEIELTGIKVDVPYLQELIKEYQEVSDNAAKIVYKIVGREFSIDSPVQLSNLLYKELKLPIKKYNKPTKAAKEKNKPKSPSTDEEALGLILNSLCPEKDKDNIELIKYLLEYRKSNKLLSTYLLPSLNNRDNNDRIHPSYSIAKAATGRTSSSNPNIQNVPNSPKIRKYLVAKEGYKFITADFSQAEIRILASCSGDLALKEAFMFEDFHSKTASDMFGIPIDQVSKQQRNSAKAINFGIAYGITAEGLKNSINGNIPDMSQHVNEEECQSYIDKYYAKYTGVKKYQDNLKKEIVKNGYVMSPLGRRRRFDIYPNTTDAQLERIYNQVINFPIQAHASDMLLVLCLRLNKRLVENNLDSKIVLLCHDEMVQEVKESEVEKVLEILNDELTKPLPFVDVKMEMSIEVTDAWY